MNRTPNRLRVSISQTVRGASIQTKASFSYMVANILVRSIGFVTLPFFVRTMSTHDIGAVAVFNSWQNIVYTIFTLGVTSGSLNIALHEHKLRRDEYQSSILGISTLSAIVVALVVVAFQDVIVQATRISPMSWGVIVLLLLFYPAYEVWLVRQRFEYKYKMVILASIVMGVVSASLSIAFVTIATKSGASSPVDARIIGQFLVPILFGFYCYQYMLRKGKVFYSREFWSYTLKLSLPLVIHSLSKGILDASDRIMIVKLVGEVEAGIYSTVYSLCSLVIVVWTAINAAVMPYQFELLEAKDYKKASNLASFLMLAFGFMVLVALLLMPDVLRILTTPEYSKGIAAVPPIMVGVYTSAAYNILGNYLLFKKQTTRIMLSTFLAAVVNIILNLALIPIYGYIAAAYTTAISFLLLIIVLSWAVKKEFGGLELIELRSILIIGSFCVLVLLSVFIIRSPIARYSLVAIMSVFVTVFGLMFLRKIRTGRD